MPISSGHRLGPYEILAPLGSGGMGELYKARDRRLGREVAIKILRADKAAGPDRIARFLQEARAASVSIILTSSPFKTSASKAAPTSW